MTVEEEIRLFQEVLAMSNPKEPKPSKEEVKLVFGDLMDWGKERIERERKMKVDRLYRKLKMI